MKKTLLFIFLSISLAASCFAQSGAQVGDKAPPLTIDEWLKGDPVSSFENGKVYIVEFWGTWCGPCIKNIPNLSDFQNEYSDDGLIVIGVATHEFDGRETLDKFMKERGDEMKYRVAYDSDYSMEVEWDTGVLTETDFKLPIAFIINREGYVVFVGHPEDEKFGSVLKNTIDE